MKKHLSKFLVVTAIFTALFILSPMVSASPADVIGGDVCSDNELCNSDTAGSGLFSIIKTIVQVMLVVGGIVAVIMIIMGGIKFIISNGNQEKIKSARDTILYSVVGLVVTIVAFAVVSFVTTELGPKPPTKTPPVSIFENSKERKA